MVLWAIRPDGKVNFVDDNNVLVGFDEDGQCCENFGWFFSRTVPDTPDDEPKEAIDTEGFNFDTSFFQDSDGGGCESGGMVTFRLVKDAEQLFLTLYNFHNGYYSHGFTLSVGGERIREDYL